MRIALVVGRQEAAWRMGHGAQGTGVWRADSLPHALCSMLYADGEYEFDDEYEDDF